MNAAAAIALAKLAAGTNGHYVQTVAGVTVSAALSVALGSQATGVLPTANQAAQTMAGDVTGTTAAAVVARVNGATVPAAGALTTGNALRATGLSTAAWSALNLAGGAGFVSGLLPLANVGGPTGTGLEKIVLGVRQAAASLLVDADVNAAAAIAGTKVAPNFGAQNVQTTGRVLVGATPSTVALAGIHATSGDILHTRNFPNTANFGILRTNVGDSIELGSTVAAQGDVLIKTPAGGSLSVEDASIWRFVVRSNGIKCAVPVGGYSSANLPFRFQTATIDCTAGGTITLTSTQYENPILYLTGTPAADFILVLPNNDGAVFSIRNNANVAVTVRKSGGAGVTFGGSTGMRRRWVAHNGVDYEFMEVTA